MAIEDNNFLFPKDKPSVFKKTIQKKVKDELILTPKGKPIIKNSETADKKKLIKQKKKSLKIIKSIEKKTIITTNKGAILISPKKKPAIYKTESKILEKSKILNKKDFEKAKIVISLIKSKKWNSALKASGKVSDKEFRDLITWMYLKTSGNQANFSEYQKFIERNFDYPRISRLQYIAEHKIYLKNSSPTSIISWFNKYPPVSGMGKIKLAEAYLEQNKLATVNTLIKEGWIVADIAKNDLGYYRAKFKKFLSSEDHIKRADYLAWENKYWDLKRMLRYLPKDERALYNARQILMSNSYGVDKSISNVPDHLKKNIGLEFDRLKWRNRRGRLDSSLEVLYKMSNKSEEELRRADLWWKQRESVVRTLIYKKRYKTAYKIASEHSLSSGPEFAEAEWLSGWVALTFLNAAEYAINHFENFYNNVSYPISLARGAYWLGKSHQKLGNSKEANIYFEEGSRFLTTYYGQLSFKELNTNNIFSLNDDSSYSKEYEKEFYNNKLVKHVILLKELNATKYSKDIIKHLALLDVEKGSEVLAAKLSSSIERYDYAIQISKRASYEKRFFNKFNYPIINTPQIINKKNMPKSELILAIIRQESEFDKSANSYVGARGMMQLMKYTAKLVAKQAKLPYSISGLTKDPDYNIKLGTYYLNSLLEQYSGVLPFAIAAYNAGPNRVKTWRRINGDPSKQEINYINWIELIRFKETRNYVQRVLENINVYKYMLSMSPVEMNGFVR
tara:strand:+ start:114 stop:2315 length:2202 start_codon:yes stop_codon:yes gene_type:complete